MASEIIRTLRAYAGDNQNDYRHAAADRIEALEAALKPDGWQLVPKYPTWQMLAALHGMEMPSPDIYGDFTDQERERVGEEAYRIMLEVAPSPGDADGRQ